MKLLVTAAVKDKTEAGTAAAPKRVCSRLKVPKSTMAPTAPTTLNLRKRVSSGPVKGGRRFMIAFGSRRSCASALPPGRRSATIRGSHGRGGYPVGGGPDPTHRVAPAGRRYPPGWRAGGLGGGPARRRGACAARRC